MKMAGVSCMKVLNPGWCNMHKHIYHYIHCTTSALQENLNYISDSGYEIIHMSQEPNHIWYIVYDMNPRGN